MVYTAGEGTGAEVGLKVDSKTVKPPKQIIIAPEKGEKILNKVRQIL